MNFIYKIHVCKCNIFLMGSSSDQYEVTTTILCDKNWFGVYLLDSKRIIPAYFHVAFSWNTDLHIFILSPCYSFVLMFLRGNKRKNLLSNSMWYPVFWWANWVHWYLELLLKGMHCSLSFSFTSVLFFV